VYSHTDDSESSDFALKVGGLGWTIAKWLRH